MTDVPSTGPSGRLPRHVWVLLALFVLVLGFAIGGSLRAAFASPPSTGVHPSATTDLRAPVARTVLLPVGSASLRGKALPPVSGQGRVDIGSTTSLA